MMHVSLIHPKILDYKSQVNKGLENISDWLKANKLTLNVKKANLVFYNITEKKVHNDSLKTFINGEELEQQKYVKYLGIYFDSALTWVKYTDYTNTKSHRVEKLEF